MRIVSIRRFQLMGGGPVVLLALAFSLALHSSAFAQPTIVYSSPADGATGVSATTPFIVQFSKPMNTQVTYALFVDHTTGNPFITVDSLWSADMTRVTNTPAPSWPPNKRIDWSMNGFDQDFNPLMGNVSGNFTIGGGGGTTGSGTNKITTFAAGKVYYYDQTSTAAPFFDHNVSDGFGAATTLASNRTANAISVTLPTSVTDALAEDPSSPEAYHFFDSSTNNSAFDAQYPSGDYLFNVQATSSNQQVTVTLPSTMPQPPAPHLSNFIAAQSVDPTQPFTLTWDAFSGGTANDFIIVQIGTNFMTPTLGSPGVLTGMATSVVLPANTLPPSSFLSSCYLTFYHYTGATNGSYATFAYRASSTQFFMTTTAGSNTTPLVLTNCVRASNGVFSFVITSSAGQQITVLYSDTLQPGSWNTLLTTNSPGGQVMISDPGSPGSLRRSYHARKGP